MSGALQRILVALGLAWCAAGCDDPRLREVASPPTAAGETLQREADTGTAEPRDVPLAEGVAEGVAEVAAVPEGCAATWSNARGFYAAWRPEGGGDVPLNEEFTAEVWLFADEACTQPLDADAVAIDCRMPAHRHGMLRDVALVPAGGGRYVAEEMMCHMLGEWQLYVDVTRGAVTERAQFELDLQ